MNPNQLDSLIGGQKEKTTLTLPCFRLLLAAFIVKEHFQMAKICDITGAKPVRGGRIHHRGLAKKKGGIGLQLTKTVKRTFSPNLHTKRIWVPELNRYIRVKLTARALKTVTKNGAYRSLKKAGIIK